MKGPSSRSSTSAICSGDPPTACVEPSVPSPPRAGGRSTPADETRGARTSSVSRLRLRPTVAAVCDAVTPPARPRRWSEEHGRTTATGGDLTERGPGSTWSIRRARHRVAGARVPPPACGSRPGRGDFPRCPFLFSAHLRPAAFASRGEGRLRCQDAARPRPLAAPQGAARSVVAAGSIRESGSDMIASGGKGGRFRTAATRAARPNDAHGAPDGHLTAAANAVNFGCPRKGPALRLASAGPFFVAGQSRD